MSQNSKNCYVKGYSFERLCKQASKSKKASRYICNFDHGRA